MVKFLCTKADASVGLGIVRKLEIIKHNGRRPRRKPTAPHISVCMHRQGYVTYHKQRLGLNYEHFSSGFSKISRGFLTYVNPECMIRDRYAALLRQCGKHGTIAEARRLHSELSRNGFDHDTFLSNLLIQMYGNLGAIQQARSILNAMEAPNSFSWNIMLGMYLRTGQMQQAKQLFAEMPLGSVIASNSMIGAYFKVGHFDEAQSLFETMKKRDDVTWNTMGAGRAQAGHLDQARQILERIPAWNAISWNFMITAYARNGKVSEARRVFNRAMDRDVVTWTSIIAAYAQDGHCTEAFALFREMDLEGVLANKLTFTSILHACANAGELEPGRIIHEELLTNPSLIFFEDPSIGNALVDLYGKCGLVDKARVLFDQMPMRDVVSWTALSNAYTLNDDLQQVKLMFDKIPSRDAISWNSTMSAIAHLGTIEDADAIFARTPQRNVVSWNSLIAANARNGYCETSLTLYREMLLDGERPDRITFILIVEACAALAAMSPGALVHSHVVETGTTLDAELATSIIHMYARCGDADAAGDLFDEVAPIFNHNDIAPWNVMISMHARAGLHSKVMDVFRKMAQAGQNADDITSVAVLAACSHTGVLQSALQCFQSLVGDFYVVPVVDHYICMLDAFGRTGLLEAAEELVKAMPFEADSLVWLAFLAACRTQGDVDRAKRAVGWIVKLDEGNSAPYSLLCNAFAGN